MAANIPAASVALHPCAAASTIPALRDRTCFLAMRVIFNQRLGLFRLQ
ncbi:hypothetical protein [Streptomyces sp. NPDC002104]